MSNMGEHRAVGFFVIFDNSSQTKQAATILWVKLTFASIKSKYMELLLGYPLLKSVWIFPAFSNELPSLCLSNSSNSKEKFLCVYRCRFTCSSVVEVIGTSFLSNGFIVSRIIPDAMYSIVGTLYPIGLQTFCHIFLLAHLKFFVYMGYYDGPEEIGFSPSLSGCW